MIVTFLREWTNEYGHKFKAGETVELWDARRPLREGVCRRVDEPAIDIAEVLQPKVEEQPQEIITKSKKGTK